MSFDADVESHQVHPHGDSASATSSSSGTAADEDLRPPAKIVICGGGIIGLVLALALKKHCGAIPEIYEQSPDFPADAGAGLMLSANGLRVIRDIDPQLLQCIVSLGATFTKQEWDRHDGHVVVQTDDANHYQEEGGNNNADDVGLALPAHLGIRRWKLQKALFQAVHNAGISLWLNKETVNVTSMQDNDDLVQVHFKDGSSRVTQLLFGCDGTDSQVRFAFSGSQHDLEYTDVTCFMGIAEQTKANDVQLPFDGLLTTTSTTTESYATNFPTGHGECCFQIFTTILAEQADKLNWGNLSQTVQQHECAQLAQHLRTHQWQEHYLTPLQHAKNAVRVGFCLLEPPLEKWVFGGSDLKKKQNGNHNETATPRVVLVGDAAHPPVPYLGQGCQMGLEDAGTFAWLLKTQCLNHETKTLDFTGEGYLRVVQAYHALRIPRCRQVLEASKNMGERQARRVRENTRLEEELQLKCDASHGGLYCQFAKYNYRTAVERHLTGQSPEPEELGYHHRHHGRHHRLHVHELWKKATSFKWHGKISHTANVPAEFANTVDNHASCAF